jgi:nicotinate-nucleotide adenylyltransferase
MKIGLYFGSFNPLHIGHLIIANHVLNETDLNKIWFVVSPQNPFKSNNTLLNETHRLQLVRLAVEQDNRIKVSDVEFSMPRPSYTIDTLTYLKEKNPDDSFSIIMGSDSFQNLDKWKNYKMITEAHTIYVYKRNGFEINNTHGANIIELNAPLLQISATYIRELIKAGKSIKYLVPEIVREEIETRKFYKNRN